MASPMGTRMRAAIHRRGAPGSAGPHNCNLFYGDAAVEAEIGDVMLAAGVEAAADGSTESTDDFVGFGVLARRGARGAHRRVHVRRRCRACRCRCPGRRRRRRWFRRRVGRVRLSRARCRAREDRLQQPSAARDSVRRCCGWFPSRTCARGRRRREAAWR